MSRSSAKSGNTSLPRRERERLSHQDEIVTAACIVFGEKGFERATLDEIAERAEFGKGTLYNYFTNKDGLFEAAVQRVLDDFRAIALDVTAMDLTVRQCFTEYTQRAVAYYREHYAFCHMVMMEHARRSIEGPTDVKKKHREKVDFTVKPLAMRLRAGMKSGEIRRGDPQTLAHVFIGFLDHYYMHTTRDQLPETKRELKRQVDTLISVFFDGIAVPGGEGDS